jgi:hypothetical protein
MYSLIRGANFFKVIVVSSVRVLYTEKRALKKQGNSCLRKPPYKYLIINYIRVFVLAQMLLVKATTISTII